MTQAARARSRICALLLGASMLAGQAVAQAPSPSRVGYVDMKRLLDNAPQVIAGRQKLEREFTARDAALKTDEKRAADLRERQKKEAPTATKTGADSLQRELDALDRSIKRTRETMATELKTRSNQELDRSWRDINDAVVEFAREQGYDMIVASGSVVYASAKVDVTEQILDRLKRTSAKATAP
ncbi:MAG: OmpH family outer membrane protein [Dokdonella sp.]|uniref:OmpH family outer membrane protein n=1 Tax=Dokdonella sp. TaxID=2291710 RepID=UPI0032645DDC